MSKSKKTPKDRLSSSSTYNDVRDLYNTLSSKQKTTACTLAMGDTVTFDDLTLLRQLVTSNDLKLFLPALKEMIVSKQQMDKKQRHGYKHIIDIIPEPFNGTEPLSLPVDEKGSSTLSMYLEFIQ
jgi:hypothetical protein